MTIITGLISKRCRNSSYAIFDTITVLFYLLSSVFLISENNGNLANVKILLLHALRLYCIFGNPLLS